MINAEKLLEKLEKSAPSIITLTNSEDISVSYEENNLKISYRNSDLDLEKFINENPTLAEELDSELSDFVREIDKNSHDFYDNYIDESEYGQITYEEYFKAVAPFSRIEFNGWRIDAYFLEDELKIEINGEIQEFHFENGDILEKYPYIDEENEVYKGKISYLLYNFFLFDYLCMFYPQKIEGEKTLQLDSEEPIPHTSENFVNMLLKAKKNSVIRSIENGDIIKEEEIQKIINKKMYRIYRFKSGNLYKVDPLKKTLWLVFHR